MSGDSIYRRDFLGKVGRVSLGTLMAGQVAAQAVAARAKETAKPWEPVSDRKVRVGIVG